MEGGGHFVIFSIHFSTKGKVMLFTRVEAGGRDDEPAGHGTEDLQGDASGAAS